jgi:hypothetical protein
MYSRRGVLGLYAKLLAFGADMPESILEVYREGETLKPYSGHPLAFIPAIEDFQNTPRRPFGECIGLTT